MGDEGFKNPRGSESIGWMWKPRGVMVKVVLQRGREGSTCWVSSETAIVNEREVPRWLSQEGPGHLICSLGEGRRKANLKTAEE